MDRLERLVNLVAALLDADRPLTRQELRQRVGGYSEDPGAFRRNFERDKEILRQMGMPLVTEALDGGGDDQAGYRIPRERYELADPGLSETELAALRLAVSAVQLDAAWGGEATLSALRKLAAAGDGTPGAAGAETDAAAGAAPPPARVAELAGGESVVAIFGAITERRRLRLTYHGEARTVDPWRLSYRRGQWYLSGYDHHRGGERVFRVDRIEGAVSPEGDAGVFDLPSGGVAAPPPAWRLGDDPEVAVRVRIDGDQAPWAVVSAGEDAVVARLPDGAVEMELAVTNRAALRSWVLGFLDHAQVLGPPGEREEMRRWLAALAGAAR